MQAGAPMRRISASEQLLQVVYLIFAHAPWVNPAAWTEDEIQQWYEANREEPSATLTFTRAWCHYFGPPNEEVLTGHPLGARGLRPSAFPGC